MPRLGGRGEYGRLDGSQLKAFREALADAFDNLEHFDEMLLYYLNKNRQKLSVKPNLLAIIQDVINDAETRSWTAELLRAARVAEPTNAPLIIFAEQFRLSSITTPARELERMIREANASFDVMPWLKHLGEVEPCVCRVEVPVGADLEPGTGFLLGPEVVMTNYHVMEKVIKGKVKPERVRLRFDFKMLSNGETLNPGTVIHLAQTDWLLDQSEYSELDFNKDTASANVREDQLDYVLLRVEGEPGNSPIGGSENADPNPKPRGWIKLPDIAPTFQPNTPLFILQHPKGRELKLALDTYSIIAVNANYTRVRYKTNTESGSSGSPCFDLNWQLIALHHSGDPDYTKFHNPEYNEGIPIWTIRNLLDKRSKLNLLG